MAADPLRLFVGTGPEGLRPSGYKTIDIVADHHPDIVADAASLPMIANGAADEFYASHVLEHFSWPRALLVLQEWARVLKLGGIIKIAVPDMEIYAHFLLNGRDPFNVIHEIYGGHWVEEGGPQGHHFGYTRRTLTEVLTVMGFGRFGFWRSELVEAANTWKYGENQERLGISLNISAIKEREPLVDIAALAHHIRHRDLKESFMVLVRNLLVDKGQLTGIGEIDAVLFQKLNFQYLDAANLAAHYRERLEQTACVPGASDAAATRDAGSLLSRSVVRARPTQERAAHQPSNAAIPDEIEHSSGHLLRGGILQKLLEIGQEAIARLVNIEIKINDLTRDMRLGFGNIPRQLGGVKVASAPSDDAFAQFAGSSDQAFGHLTYAQHGEDLIVANIFALLKIEHPTYLDVGANHPIVGSNTALLYARGSRGIAVEANPALLPLWQELRPGDVALNLAVGTEKGELTLFRIDEFSGRNTTSRSVAEDFVAAYPQFRVQDMLKVKATTLNDIVAEHTGGNWPDFLSIDLEGLDYAVLAVADFSFGRPTVLCVEWRDASGGDESARFFPLLDVQGFVPVFRTWGNLIAVHRSAIAALGLGAAD